MAKDKVKQAKSQVAVASLCGLVLRRLQDNVGVHGITETDDTPVTVADLSRIFGEALEQFSAKGEIKEEA